MVIRARFVVVSTPSCVVVRAASCVVAKAAMSVVVSVEIVVVESSRMRVADRLEMIEATVRSSSRKDRPAIGRCPASGLFEKPMTPLEPVCASTC